MFFEGALSTYFWESLSHCPTLCFRFWRLYIKKCTKKKHEEYSWNFTCAHVLHARVFNGGAIACGAVLTWHLNDFVGRGWVGWWLIQGMWVGAATTDTRVVVGGLVVLSDFVPKRCFLRVPERILRVPKQLPDPLIQGAAHLNAKNDFLKTLHKEMYQRNMMNILEICMRTCHTRSCVQSWCTCSWCSTDLTP